MFESCKRLTMTFLSDLFSFQHHTTFRRHLIHRGFFRFNFYSAHGSVSLQLLHFYLLCPLPFRHGIGVYHSKRTNAVTTFEQRHLSSLTSYFIGHSRLRAFPLQLSPIWFQHLLLALENLINLTTCALHPLGPSRHLLWTKTRRTTSSKQSPVTIYLIAWPTLSSLNQFGTLPPRRPTTFPFHTQLCRNLHFELLPNQLLLVAVALQEAISTKPLRPGIFLGLVHHRSVQSHENGPQKTSPNFAS